MFLDYSIVCLLYYIVKRFGQIVVKALYKYQYYYSISIIIFRLFAFPMHICQLYQGRENVMLHCSRLFNAFSLAFLIHFSFVCPVYIYMWVNFMRRDAEVFIFVLDPTNPP